MTLPKFFAFFVAILFGGVALLFFLKREGSQLPQSVPQQKAPVSALGEDLPPIDRVHHLFAVGSTKFPIVETITYTSRAPWLPKRLAWLADYAVHYGTSKHFISRSLTGKADYYNEKLVEGCHFNVFRKDRKFEFYLVVDTSLAKMAFYYFDEASGERVLLKTYSVAVGKDELTPLGRFKLGSRIAAYREQEKGFYQGKEVEMVKVFGTRWIPFHEERGLGLTGLPLGEDPALRLGKKVTDGCIQLGKEEIEELFAIVVTRPTTLEVVKGFREASLPGVEVATPTPLMEEKR